jgi:hypothetical protein
MSNAAPVMPKINYASSMIVEDHLKKLLTMTRGKAWKFTDNKMLPRSQHSPFGDFPPEYMKDVGKKDTTPVPQIDNAEQSIAATGKGKFFRDMKQLVRAKVLQIKLSKPPELNGFVNR